MLGKIGTEDDFPISCQSTFKLTVPSGALNNPADARPAARHANRANIAWMDGYINLLRLEQFYTQQTPPDRFFTPSRTMLIFIPTLPDFSFLETVSAHGWRQLLPFVWNEDALTLARTEEFSEHLITLTISAADDAVQIETDRDCGEAELAARVSRMLQIDLPLTGFHAYCRTQPELTGIADCRRGRLLRSPTLWEDVVKVIATTNTTWAQTISMSARLVQEFGRKGRAFPSAAEIAEVSLDDFAAKARMGYRAAYVHAIAVAIAEGSLELEAWQTELTADTLRRSLLSLPGIGPYGAACLLLYLGKPAHVNSDSVARTLLAKEIGQSVTDKDVHAFFKPHSEWQGLVYNFYPWK